MKLDKKSVRIHILNLQDENCVGCKKVPVYGKSGNRKISWCTDNCEIGKQVKQFGDTLLEGRNEMMAEERNWDVLCEKAEKLREEKLSWAKIADRLGVSESTLYHNVAKRREKKEGAKRRLGASMVKKNIKPVVKEEKISKKETGHSREGNHEIPQMKLQVELEKLKKQLQDREEDYTTLLNECNQLSEKKWEVEAELRKTQIRIGAAEETAEMERKHRLECQAKVQALGIALKAVL
ncbi:zinc-finger domain-containing protein [Bacillus toyonensis]|uniref:zinc-finger domain-containing protein n=1 Tax=Bacillus toyonensis TaxID=155322 RepID=UPI000BFE868A|nr:zinc-finger domain-containing protein [Bacillus toyonensis]PHG62512.1 antiphagocytic M protein [Bacillus toyonensis]